MRPPANPFSSEDPDFSRLYVMGAGGFGREVAWLAEQAWGDRVEIVFVVDKPEYLRDPVNGIPVHLLSEATTEDSAYVVAIGEPAARRVAVTACQAQGLTACVVSHPRAEMSQWVDLKEGAVVCAGVIATTNVIIGEHAHINLDCTIGHDAEIGAFATLSPGVHVSGNVIIGSDVFVGTGANIINGSACAPLVIGDGAVVAAGACVTKSVEPGALVAGVPAVRKR